MIKLAAFREHTTPDHQFQEQESLVSGGYYDSNKLFCLNISLCIKLIYS